MCIVQFQVSSTKATTGTFLCLFLPLLFVFEKIYVLLSRARKNGIDIFRIFNVVFLCMRMCRVNSRRSLKSAAWTTNLIIHGATWCEMHVILAITSILNIMEFAKTQRKLKYTETIGIENKRERDVKQINTKSIVYSYWPVKIVLTLYYIILFRYFIVIWYFFII